jgi:hypothetical protein
MIKVILISSLAVLVSCASMKEKRAAKQAAKAPVEQVVTEVANENALPTQERPMSEEDMMDMQGTVRLNRPGCPVSIDMIKGDLFTTLYPVNLDRQYYKEGLKIKFNYAPSRAPSPESCTADMVVAVSEVQIIK